MMEEQNTPEYRYEDHLLWHKFYFYLILPLALIYNFFGCCRFIVDFKLYPVIYTLPNLLFSAALLVMIIGLFYAVTCNLPWGYRLLRIFLFVTVIYSAASFLITLFIQMLLPEFFTSEIYASSLFNVIVSGFICYANLEYYRHRTFLFGIYPVIKEKEHKEKTPPAV